ncbi:MAG: hypothetical protein RMX35_33070 [Nostoc sp. DcaGUA01]|nr:hypothetical protein [Nostoc sp. DcaGUA01]
MMYTLGHLLEMGQKLAKFQNKDFFRIQENMMNQQTNHTRFWLLTPGAEYWQRSI